MIRRIVRINEALCNGCGECVPSCEERALRILNGKARLVDDSYCDGLGACLGHCPSGAITLVEKGVDSFNDEPSDGGLGISAATSRRSQEIIEPGPVQSPATEASASKSALRQWPVQFRLVSVKAPFLKRADLLLVADCVPFAYPGLHSHLLLGKAVLVGCPKFDDVKSYSEKLGEILRLNELHSLTLVSMEVPCCQGVNWVAERALRASGKTIPVRRYITTIRGELKEERS